jgi:hypothetical protein
VTVTEWNLERRVDRLEDQQATWLRLTTDLLTRESARDARLERMEGDISTLKTEMVEVKGQLNRLEVASVRNHNWVKGEFEWLRGYIARREAGER